jgi:chromosome segregation ATPase
MSRSPGRRSTDSDSSVSYLEILSAQKSALEQTLAGLDADLSVSSPPPSPNRSVDFFSYLQQLESRDEELTNAIEQAQRLNRDLVHKERSLSWRGRTLAGGLASTGLSLQSHADDLRIREVVVEELEAAAALKRQKLEALSQTHQFLQQTLKQERASLSSRVRETGDLIRDRLDELNQAIESEKARSSELSEILGGLRSQQNADRELHNHRVHRGRKILDAQSERVILQTKLRKTESQLERARKELRNAQERWSELTENLQTLLGEADPDGSGEMAKSILLTKLESLNASPPSALSK